MTDLVLLGAGASAHAGIPTSFGMTDAIRNRLGNSELAETMDFVCDSMSRRRSPDDPAQARRLDVEEVFSAVEMLAERETLEVSAFVETWSRGVERLERGGGAWTPGGANAFANLRDRMVLELRRQVATTKKQVAYLAPLVARAAEPGRATIATLNYDLSIERAGEANDIRVDTGLRDWVATGRWGWPPFGVRLLKLHGSIDWAWVDDPTERGRMPSRFVVESDDPEHDDRPPALIFGLRGKLRAEGPFLSALAAFEERAAEADRLIVIGYSFRDDHVNQVIRRWTFEDRGREIVVVDPNLPETNPPPTPGLSFRESLLANLEPATNGSSRGRARLRLVREPAQDALHRLF